jgi:RNA polymerase sigma-70 factor (ECF subfamily)
MRAEIGTPSGEAGLLHRCAEGDQAAFDELYRQTAPWLLVRLRRRCADDELVAEALQETYLAVWRAAGTLSGFDSDGGAVGWLWTIAARRLADGFRRRARQGKVPPALSSPAVAPAAEDQVLGAELGEDMERALMSLAPDLRRVLQALVLDGLSVRETSLLLGLPEGTVKTRARRARIALRGALT